MPSVTVDSTYYTSLAEIQRLFSVDAVENRRDDYTALEPDYVDTMNEIIIRAHYEVKSIINKLFDDSVAKPHPWIRARATYIGAYLLSIRRGNDSQYFNEYLEALEDLTALVNGERYLDDLPANVTSQAVFLNVSSDNRYPFTPMRIDPISATPDVSGVRFVQRYIPFSWL
jgi:hypothetical protein